MEYNFEQDLRAIREILGMTQAELAQRLDVEQVTISRNELGNTAASGKFMEQVYEFAFKKGIRINKLKEMFWKESIDTQYTLLFHGAKSEINGDINIRKSRANNDFGQGFYAGESYEQAISFISAYDKSSVYFLEFNGEGLKSERYEVNQDWMMTIAYYRGALDEYKAHPSVKSLIEKSRDCDYIIAPIADNRMFQIINSFINGEITDEQCKHCLAATNLGSQYVFISDEAVSRVKIIERCYICANEKEYYKSIRSSDAKLGDDKVKLARINYRGKGRYIDEILN